MRTTILRTLGLMAGLLVMGSGNAAPADGTPTVPIPAPEHRTLDEFGAANKACREWTDGCAVCLRQDDGSFGCSLPGIACEPGPIACRDAPASKDAPASQDTPVIKDPPATKDAAPDATIPTDPKTQPGAARP